MKRLKNMLFSMELTGLLLVLFFVAIAVATFIENDFGTLTAKAKVYNSTWFEILLSLLAINMTGSIFKHKLYLKHKWPVLLFHVSFLIIFLGSALTRFIGFEGMMSIREGSASGEFMSDETYIRIWADDGTMRSYKEDKVLASPISAKGVSNTLKLGNQKVSVKIVDYFTHAAETFEEAPGGEPMVWLVLSSGNSGRQNMYLRPTQTKQMGGLTFHFGEDAVPGAMNITRNEGALYFQFADTVAHVNMMAGTTTTVPADSVYPLQSMNLYEAKGLKIVMKAFYESAVRKLVSTDGKDGMGSMDALLARITANGETVELPVYGGKGYTGDVAETTVGGINVVMRYGAITRQLPFAIKLLDFQLERYPGSNSPSSYASEVVLMDQEKGVEMPYRIYMNHILNYRGYRFFQSSYDRDEKGTILSVNHDAPGTIVTYIGYLLMAIGMIITIFSKGSRFRTLIRLSEKMRETRKKELTAVLVLGILLAGASFNPLRAQYTPDQIPVIDEQHASEFGRLLIQDVGGRIKPVNTLASEVLRKLARKTSYYGQNPEQVFLGIMVYPEYWENVPLIKIAHPEIANMLGVEGTLATFNQIVDLHNGGGYKLSEYVERAFAKKPAEQTKFDKELIKVDERVNIFYLTYTGTFLRAFPIPNDPNNKWVTAADSKKFANADDANFVNGILGMYFNEIAGAVQSGNWSGPDQTFNSIRQFQMKFGSRVLPSESKIDQEILYNRINIFKKLAHYYLYVGFVLMVLLFINILKPKMNLKMVIRIALILILILFIAHTAGLILRWYISGHAPWSNGYESLIFIAWATVLAGIIFARNSEVALAAASVLGSIFLTVAGMSWMDPEITPLVPVLKSYWLIIHVAMITASYGFLGLAAILGLFNLFLMISKNKSNTHRINLTLAELNYILEMTMVVGLFMLTIGTFLGGVWANESWGRYWGWDPKETWALATVLLYSFIVHMRYIPGFRGHYALSLLGLLGYSAVMMTYFGVNYYLSGLHSYAAGDPVPIPTFVYYTYGSIAVISVIAYLKDRIHQ
ncbi:MAG TPA: c-type cytochrome biogenesis protein CcsB [Bacteroidales bacterium]|mgnify:CR=1 FL=1|nr:c-type cytochrome biogenesis protein CcsB [Bacteroidales bacterium]